MLSGIIARARSLWRGVRGYSSIDAEMSEEFRLHLELRAADLVRSGLTPAAAIRRARSEFGNPARLKEEGRESRGLHHVDALRVSWLDFKLGFRMLIKYPGLTIIGGLAIAFAIWIGAGTFEIMTQVLHPTLPLDEGSRLVGLRSWDAKANRREPRIVHDFLAWRAELKSVEDLGAFRITQRNLILGDGAGEPIEVAEVSASAFRVSRVPPLLGRTLLDADAAEGAPPVVVVGHELWQRRFAGDSAIVGTTVRLGRSPSTVVGVMPEGFEFPVSQEFWVPLRLNARDYQRREGPAIQIFGRLAPGASLGEAAAELSAIGSRTAADFPGTHEHLRPQIMPYARSVIDIPPAETAALVSMNLPMLMLLVLICGNVALLMFARAATRETELAVRSALGASRARIIMQLFAEALVLGSVAAVIGLAAAGKGLAWVMRVAELEMLNGRRLPFWFAGRLSMPTVIYALALTLLVAVIAGVVPALKVTRGMGTSLQRASAGSGGMKFGGIWTAVIICQIAITVAFPAVAFFVRRDGVQIEAMDVGFPTREYLALRVEMDREPPPGAAPDTSPQAFRARYGETFEELRERLNADPAVAGVTFANRLPLTYHPHRVIELDPGGGAPLHPDWPAGYRVSDATVDIDFPKVLDAPVLAGRNFTAGDLEANVVSVIVNESFVRLVLGGRNPLGRRLRYVYTEESETPMPVAERGPWYEIVGVVRDLGMATEPDPKVAGIYHPSTPARSYPAQLAIHVRGPAESFVPRLRAIATATDPTLRLYDVQSMDHITDAALEGIAFWFGLLTAVSAIALVLSLAGVYAVMSFTVAKRTREIGIRVALGASHRRVITGIFMRPFGQVVAGILVGSLLLVLMTGLGTSTFLTPKQALIIGAYSLGMMVVCLLACVVPTRRALRIEPTEALRADA
jgi:predicted permease